MRIALDAMGGDYAPKNTVEGAVLALKEYSYIEKLFLVGDAVATRNELKRRDFKDARIEIFHASEVVSMKESAAKAVRHKKDASSKMDRLKRSFPPDTPGRPWWPASSNSGR
jgi:glycerol-3-phosphate acyltransferase PlsX